MKKIFHKSIIFMAIITLIIGCFGCNNTSSHKDSTPSVDSNDSNNSMGNQENSDNEGETATDSAHIDILAPLTDKDKLTDYDDDVTTITLSNNKISADNNSVTISGNVATITQKGDYIITGTIDDGQIIVEVENISDYKKTNINIYLHLPRHNQPLLIPFLPLLSQSCPSYLR